MVIEDLDYLFPIDDIGLIQGGLYADVMVNTYASPNFSYADANAYAVGNFTWVSTDTKADLYQGWAVDNSRAYGHGTARASAGQDNYWVSVTESQQHWW